MAQINFAQKEQTATGQCDTEGDMRSYSWTRWHWDTTLLVLARPATHNNSS